MPLLTDTWLATETAAIRPTKDALDPKADPFGKAEQACFDLGEALYRNEIVDPKAISAATLDYAVLIESTCPDCDERTEALRSVRLAYMMLTREAAGREDVFPLDRMPTLTLDLAMGALLAARAWAVAAANTP